ncbi:Na+/H+ antiporter subunit G [Candidatus Izimaplasma bacterium ZiA1]|uniref:monovalent cation/H(+) antiporter subunit G n=1 Tax=Candidatus Izimoplasma sp. ZiA1 TaxID=2024899 RepID=UPI000BAA3B43|nr:Na+/H+ antiporter subunit G [Candidatus Izimaplasma bacterium ZiA1]
MEIASNVFLIIGGLFYLLGGLGILRMPDTFNRIQAGTKATTLGAFALLIGVGFANPEWVLKVFLIILFITVSNPIGSSALAKATYLSGYRPENLVQDDLKELLGGEDNGTN